MRVMQTVFIMIAATLLPTAAFPQAKPAPDDAYLYFVWPQDGTVIKGALWCRFGLRNMGVTHAGDDFPNSGHHHLLTAMQSIFRLNRPSSQKRSRS